LPGHREYRRIDVATGTIEKVLGDRGFGFTAAEAGKE